MQPAALHRGYRLGRPRGYRGSGDYDWAEKASWRRARAVVQLDQRARRGAGCAFRGLVRRRVPTSAGKRWGSAG
jgi:hypothetical protein